MMGRGSRILPLKRESVCRRHYKKGMGLYGFVVLSVGVCCLCVERPEQEAYYNNH